MIIAHPLFCQRLQFFGNVDLPGAALGVAHGQIIGWTVFLALHALTARLATLREPLNEGGTQNGTQPAKLLDELAPTQRELMYLRTRHVLTLARVLRQCKQKMFGKALFLLRSRAGSERPTADRTKTDGRQGVKPRPYGVSSYHPLPNNRSCGLLLRNFSAYCPEEAPDCVG